MARRAGEKDTALKESHWSGAGGQVTLVPLPVVPGKAVFPAGHGVTGSLRHSWPVTPLGAEPRLTGGS